MNQLQEFKDLVQDIASKDQLRINNAVKNVDTFQNKRVLLLEQ